MQPVVTLLLVASARAACPDFSACPLATDLHPVAHHYGLEYQRALRNVMAGERSSPLFGAMMNEAEVHWRLLDATGVGLSFTRPTLEYWRDLTLIGSFLAFNQVLDRTFERAPALQTIRLVVDTAISPSLDLTVRRDGRVRVGHRTGWEVGQRLDAAGEEAGFVEPRSRRPRLRIHAGVGWQLRDPEAPEADPLLSWTAHASVSTRAGLGLRADWSLVDNHWESLARVRLFDDVSAESALRSEEDGPEPRRWTAGLLWNPEPRWTIRLVRGAPVAGEAWDLAATVRVELGGRLPGRLDPSLAGLPAVADRSPNDLGPAWSWPQGR